MSDKQRGKKRSKGFYIKSSSNKKIRRDKSLDVGMRGFLLTCNRTEQLCVREGYSLLEEYADKLYGPEKVGEEDCESSGSEFEPEDIEASLRKEIAEMKQKQAEKKTRFEAINSGANNVVFIRTKLLDPTELVHHILMDISNTKTSKSCHIMRMLPVNITCRASIEDITKHAPDFLHPYFHADGVKPATFAVRIKIRNNASIKRDDIIKLIAAMVMSKGIKHKVDLTDPELSMVVEIIKNVVCLSVLKDFNQLKKYNLQEIVGDGGAAQKNAPSRSAKGTSKPTETNYPSRVEQDLENNGKSEENRTELGGADLAQIQKGNIVESEEEQKGSDLDNKHATQESLGTKTPDQPGIL